MISFCNIVNELSKYWKYKGCKLIQPIDIPVGAATMHPHFILNARNPHKLAYIQPCRRPQDSRSNSKNRLYKHHQFQVTMSPIPNDPQELFLESLRVIGFNFKENEIKFVAGDWKSPNLGAFGVGSEILANNAEISQFTYFQQIGGKDLVNPIIEITYGLERVAMQLQQVSDWREIIWQDDIKYKDIDDNEFSLASTSKYNIKSLYKMFELYINESTHLIDQKLKHPAYEQFLLANHTFNILEASQAFSPTQRVDELKKLRNIGQKCINIGELS